MTRLRLLLVLTTLTMLNGCATVLHPISRADIWSVEKGDKIQRKDGSIALITKDGYVLSDFYISQVMKAKVK